MRMDEIIFFLTPGRFRAGISETAGRLALLCILCDTARMTVSSRAFRENKEDHQKLPSKMPCSSQKDDLSAMQRIRET